MSTGGLRRAGRPTGVSPAIARRMRLAAAFSSPEGHFAAVPVLLGCVLVGYAFGGRAFADLGVAPIFIGEVALAVGVVGTLVHRRRIAAFRSLLSVGILLFCLWGAIRTLPFLPVYGVDALRDAVIWGYAVFALLIPVYVTRLEHFETLARRYSQILPWFMAWVPFAMLIDRAAPGGLMMMKGGDAAVHLGGAAAFIMLGLHQAGKTGPAARGRTWKELMGWVLWPAAFLFAASANRGGLLAALVAIVIVAAFWPAAAARKLVLAGAVVSLIGLVLVAMERGSGGASLATPHHGRSVAPSQVAENLMSVMAEDANAPLSGTKIWRLLWWGDIVGYTVHGDYFWTGKGFGVNLADDDGYQLGGALRSPHNGHLTILARAGVPGAVLWIGLQAAFAASLLVAYIRARRAQHITWAKVNLWLMAYWAAFMVNATFDVYLEGPQGGIWFWSVVGLGIAALIAQREVTGPEPRLNRQRASA